MNALSFRRLARLVVFSGLFLGLDVLGLHAEMRTFTDKQGRSIKAELTAVDGDNVTIKREDGQSFTLSLASLSDDDRQFIKEWAAKPQPLPPGSLLVELSRAVFDTSKKDSDVTLTTGAIVKNGLTTTEEKWGYSVTIQNKTSKSLEGLRADYRLFATVDNIHVKEKQGLKKKPYQSVIDTIPALSRVVFRTETISAFKMKFNGNIVSAKTGESSSRETLTGIWIRIYQGDDVVYETAMPQSLTSTEKW